MKAFIPSYNRAQTIKTHLLLKDSPWDWKIVLHSMEQAHEYLKNPSIPADRITVSNQPAGISRQRNWIKNVLVSPGEWFVMMDDNIEAFNIYPEPFYSTVLQYEKGDKSTRPYTLHYADMARLDAVVQETIAKAEEMNIGFCAFSAGSNEFFRNRKWQTVGMVCSKFCIVKADELRYDENVQTMDDYAYSVESMIKYGRLLFNKYAWPKANHNQAGGLGKLKERGDKKIKDCAYLMSKYPGLFRYKQRKNSLPMAEIVLRGYSEAFFANWRKSWLEKQSLAQNIEGK